MHYDADLLIYIHVPCSKKQQFAGKPTTILLQSHEESVLSTSKTSHKVRFLRTPPKVVEKSCHLEGLSIARK